MNDEFYETVVEIAEWHETAFPDTTEEEQIIKLNEEFEEWADNFFIEGLADCFIVAAGLSERWGNTLGGFLTEMIVSKCGPDADLLMDAIKAKMEVNRKRKWVYLGGGRYDHVEGGKNGG